MWGATASSDRRIVAACHDQGARIGGPRSGARGRGGPAPGREGGGGGGGRGGAGGGGGPPPGGRAPPAGRRGGGGSRSWLNRAGGWPITSRTRARAGARDPGSRSGSRASEASVVSADG